MPNSIPGFLLKAFVDLAKQVFRKIGWAGFRVSSGYEFVFPRALYAPWTSDKEFLGVFDRVRRNTLIDVYRAYELWQLVEETASVPGAYLEVGVWRGGSGGLMASRAKMLGLMETLYLCDTFEGVVKAGARDNRYRGKEHADTSMNVVRELMSALGLANFKLLKGIFPEQTASQIPDGARFRMCHIDVDVYESAKDIFEWVWPKMSRGGVVIFDDYGFHSCKGVTDFVNEKRKDTPDLFFVHNLNGHAICIKT